MPSSKLTLAEREKIENFPKDISNDDLNTYFTLSPRDQKQVPTETRDYNRLGFASSIMFIAIPRFLS